MASEHECFTCSKAVFGPVWPCTYLANIGIEVVIVTVVLVMKMTWHADRHASTFLTCYKRVGKALRMHALLHHNSCMPTVVNSVACCCHGYAISHLGPQPQVAF